MRTSNLAIPALKASLSLILLAGCNLPLPEAKDAEDTAAPTDTSEEQVEVPEPSLWLKFDDSPGWLVDSSGDATVTIADGTPQTTGGLSGGGIQFRTNRADELAIADLEVPSGCDWTLTTWFEIGEDENWDGTRVLLAASVDMQHVAVDQNYLITHGPGGQTRSNVDFTSLAAGWHHLAVITDCDDTTSIVLNGSTKDTISTAVRLPVTRIGNSGFGDEDWLESWGTALDDLRLYDQELTEEQVDQIMLDL